MLQESGLDPAEWASVPFYEGAGCLECSGSGYRGPHRHYRAFGSVGPDSGDDYQSPADFGNQDTPRARKGCRSCANRACARCAPGMTTLREINKVTFLD